MEAKQIISTVKKGLHALEELAPLVPNGVLPALDLIKYSATLTSIVTNVNTRIKERKIVATSMDNAQIVDILNRLGHINDGLNKEIADS